MLREAKFTDSHARPLGSSYALVFKVMSQRENGHGVLRLNFIRAHAEFS